MRKVLSALAVGALAITLSAPAAHAAPSASPAQQVFHHHRCHEGLVGYLLGWLI